MALLVARKVPAAQVQVGQDASPLDPVSKMRAQVPVSLAREFEFRDTVLVRGAHIVQVGAEASRIELQPDADTVRRQERQVVVARHIQFGGHGIEKAPQLQRGVAPVRHNQGNLQVQPRKGRVGLRKPAHAEPVHLLAGRGMVDEVLELRVVRRPRNGPAFTRSP